MASLAESLPRERTGIFKPDRAWYRPVPTTVPFEQLVRSEASPWATAFQVEHVTASASRKTGKRRPKDYSSDSSASERETDKHTEGRIYRAPSGSGKDYYVYYKGKKISFWRLVDEEPQQQRRRAQELPGETQPFREEGQDQGWVLGMSRLAQRVQGAERQEEAGRLRVRLHQRRGLGDGEGRLRQ